MKRQNELMSEQQLKEQLLGYEQSVYQEKKAAILQKDKLFLQEQVNLLKYYRECYEGMKEEFGEDCEETIEMLENLKQLMSLPITQCKEQIIDFFDLWSGSVWNNPEYYLKTQLEDIRLIRLFSPEYQAAQEYKKKHGLVSWQQEEDS